MNEAGKFLPVENWAWLTRLKEARNGLSRARGPIHMSGQTPEVILLAEAAGGVVRHVIDLYRGLRARHQPVPARLIPAGQVLKSRRDRF
jgi:hypothetical protein